MLTNIGENYLLVGVKSISDGNIRILLIIWRNKWYLSSEDNHLVGKGTPWIILIRSLK